MLHHFFTISCLAQSLAAQQPDLQLLAHKVLILRPKHAGLLEHLPVLAYGDTMSLQSLASVSVQDGQTLLVTPFDPQVPHPGCHAWSPLLAMCSTTRLSMQCEASGQSIRLPVQARPDAVLLDY